jgi:hypothetical protein
MSEEKETHPQEPAEGGDDQVGAPGADKPGDENRQTAEDASAEARSKEHPQEPAEGGDDEVDEPGADRPGDGG